jgi:uncharacterized protein (DUF697 family)
MADTTQKSAQADSLIRKHMFGAMASGLIPMPWVDAAALTALQLNLLRCLAGVYGVDFSSQIGKSVIATLVGGVLPANLSAQVATLAKGLPGVGWLAGAGSAAVLGAASTYALGKVFVQHFESGNTFLSFDPEKVRAYYAQQYDQGKEEVRTSFVGLMP